MEKLFKNIEFKERNYETTNIVFAVAETAPQKSEWIYGTWVEVDPSEFDNDCIHLYTSCGIQFYGFL